MASTFFGLNIARSGLFVAQRALGVVAHNVANANTPGFSRQRLDIRQMTPDKLPASNGMLGTGVDSEAVKQIRDEFLDFKVRTENTSLGSWSFKRKVYAMIESIFNGISDTGIVKTMDNFFKSLHELSGNPESLTTRALVRQQSIALTEDLGRMYEQLKQSQVDMDFQLKTMVSQVNGYAEQIKDLNRIIYLSELDGSTANDIRDQRNLVVDKLSELVNIDYYEDQQNRFHVLITGKPLVSHYNVDKLTLKVRKVKKNPDDAIRLVDVGWASGVTFKLQGGQMNTLINLRDGTVAENKGIPYYIDKLNTFSDRLLSEINRIHMSGYDLERNSGTMMFTMDNMKVADYQAYLMREGLDGKPPIDLTKEVLKGTSVDFDNAKNNEIIAGNIKTLLQKNPGYSHKSIKLLSDKRYYLVDRISAGRVTISKDIDGDLNKIAASSTLEGLPGQGKNALAMADMRHNTYMFSWGSPDDYVKSLISNLGVDSAEAIRMEKNQKSLIVELENKRQSIMGVSLDEEMSEMIKFQHSYTANARMMTAMDELLELVVNRLGLVGR